MIYIKKTLAPLLILLFAPLCFAADYYVDSINGDDNQSGLSPKTAWKSLHKASNTPLQPGDSLNIKRGTSYHGALTVVGIGSMEAPIIVQAYGEGEKPLIDSRGYYAGVHVKNSRFVTVQDLNITADGGDAIDGKPNDTRFGVFVDVEGNQLFSDIAIQNIDVSNIFPGEARKHEGFNPTTYVGTGIAVYGRSRRAFNVIVQNCTIERVGFKAIELKDIDHVKVLNNFMKDIGGPAIQPGRVTDLLVRGNTVDGSGSNVDERMHNRGSGIWPWTCDDVVIEHNRFMGARGTGDSCGIHIDFNCRDVLVQYNLSIDNEGGFVEFLGNVHNSTYRYNISINDGSRVKGVNRAFQEGKILWTSGYVGSQRKKHGPYNSYIYNNTIYVAEGSRSCFSISPTTEGLFIANNIFHIQGNTLDVTGDQDQQIIEQLGNIPRSVMTNNLFINDSVWPETLPVENANALYGDAGFKNPGSLIAEDYTPTNIELVKDRGVEITKLPGDEVGLTGGLEAQYDFLGNPIKKLPDIGAIEL